MNKNHYLVEFERLKSSLIKKYGAPKSDHVCWENDLYKDDVNEWGSAISMGHLSYFCNFVTEDSDIWLALMGENYEIDFCIEYTSRALSHLEDISRENKLISEL